WSRLQPDFIHINKQNLEDGLDLLRAANSLAIPSISTIHITQTARFLGARAGWFRDWVARRSLRSYKGAYVAVQETRRRELSEFLRNGHETRTIFNGVPMPASKGLKDLRDRKRVELGIGKE